MQTHSASRIEIIIEQPALRALTRQLDRAGVKGYTVLPVFGGHGQSGPWTAEGEIGSAGGMVAVLTMVSPERAEGVLDSVFEVVSRHIGLVSVSECRVVRPERV
ncbi:MAG: P-II family nitrogen regulator [Wenzhouxiangella sp.]